MPTTFWNSWQLWEKMCFVLGSSIVVVIFLGCLKLMYNHWRLRKYTAIAVTKAAIRQEMQHSESVKRGRAREVPFGVRAIESGIEVEGVWISGSNTPANSIPGSPELSATTPRHKLAQEDSSANRASSSSNTRIEIPQPVHGHPEIILPSGNPFGNVAFEGASSSDQHFRGGRPTYQPRRSSHLRYSNDPFMAAESNGKWAEGFDSETERQSSDSTEWNELSRIGNKRQPRRPRRQRTSSGSQSIEMV